MFKDQRLTLIETIQSKYRCSTGLGNLHGCTKQEVPLMLQGTLSIDENEDWWLTGSSGSPLCVIPSDEDLESASADSLRDWEYRMRGRLWFGTLQYRRGAWTKVDQQTLPSLQHRASMISASAERRSECSFARYFKTLRCFCLHEVRT